MNINNDYALKDHGYSNYENTTSLARHRWYYYKEGFSPLFVERAIETVGLKKTDIIIDPFNGSGTTTLTAAIKGYRSVGIEVNPFTSFLSNAKLKSTPASDLEKNALLLSDAAEKTQLSNLLGFSSFSNGSQRNKWLFNDDILNAFEGGWLESNKISAYNTRKLLKLSLINAAMDNCNARRDGKCLRYMPGWQDKKYDRYTFIESLKKSIDIIKSDIEAQPIVTEATILNGDVRSLLEHSNLEPFRLCVTSPPYLNTFDYTDIYRPELFLGKFIRSKEELYKLRLRTVRSHVQAKWDLPSMNDFGILYQQTINHLLQHREGLMHKNIPLMVQAYFEDMLNVLKQLRSKAAKNAELWLVVSNSAYANFEIPVDLIIGDLGTKAGWYLKEIGVLRNIRRRKTKNSSEINQLRESVVIFSTTKK